MMKNSISRSSLRSRFISGCLNTTLSFVSFISGTAAVHLWNLKASVKQILSLVAMENKYICVCETVHSPEINTGKVSVRSKNLLSYGNSCQRCQNCGFSSQTSITNLSNVILCDKRVSLWKCRFYVLLVQLKLYSLKMQFYFLVIFTEAATNNYFLYW